jgi:hypothetical protein
MVAHLNASCDEASLPTGGPRVTCIFAVPEADTPECYLGVPAHEGGPSMLTRLRSIRAVWYLPIGMLAAIIGLLPWLITGMRLPLQNLWAGASPTDMPLVLLPFSQYDLSLIVALLVTGSAIAGALARFGRPKRSGIARIALIVGVLVVQVFAIVQTAIAVSHGLSTSTMARLYLTAVVAGTIASILLGLGVLALIGLAPVPGATIGISIAAIAFVDWLSALLVPLRTSTPNLVLFNAIHWLPAVIVGLALAWCGIRTFGRAAAAIVSILVLWIVPAAGTAAASATGSRVLAHDPTEMLAYGREVFAAALWTPVLSLWPVVVAVVVMVLGLVARWVIRRRHVAPAA